MLKKESLNLYDFVNTQTAIKPSVRLLNTLNFGKSIGVLPSAKDFIASGFDISILKTKLPNFGAKTGNELIEIFKANQEPINDPVLADSDVPNSYLPVSYLPDSIGKMSLHACIDGYAEDKRNVKKSLLLKLGDQDKSVADYFGMSLESKKKFFNKIPGLGRGAFDLLEATVDKVTQTNVVKEKKSKLTCKKKEVIEEIKNRFPKCFTPLIDRYKNKEDELSIMQFLRIAKPILETKDGDWCFRLFNGETLESIGESSNPKLTRERVRQITAEYKEYSIDPTNLEYAKQQVLSKVKDNKLPDNEALKSLNKRSMNTLYKKINMSQISQMSDRARVKLAKLLDLDVGYEESNASYWNEKSIIKALRDFAKFLGKPDLMPFQKEMLEHNRSDLRGVVSERLGGQFMAAKKAGLKYQGQKVGEDGGKTFWTNEKMKAFLYDVAEKVGRPGMMPSQLECRQYAPNPTTIITILRRTAYDSQITRSWAQTAHDYGLSYDKKIHKSPLNLEYIKLFVKSLKGSLQSFTPSEVYVLFQQAGVKNVSKNEKLFEKLVSAIQSGNLPKEELDKWMDGEQSELIENLMDPNIATTKEAFAISGLEMKGNKKIKLKSQSNEDEVYQEAIDENPPSPTVMDSLKSLGVATNVISKFSSDREAVNFFIAKATGKLWRRCFENEVEAIKEAQSYQTDNKYELDTRDAFIDEYNKSNQLPIPIGYQFRDDSGDIAYPNLMQKLIAYRVFQKERVLNLSGTGTGKTLSAVLTSRVIKANITVIACPNNTIKGWKKEIRGAFPDDSIVYKKTLDVSNINKDAHNYFVLNHEYFQKHNEVTVKQFINRYCIDFIVIDEIHRAKQRDEKKESQRRRLLTGLITDIPEGRKKPRVLGLSATPVINNIYEGKSLIELVTSQEHDDIDNHTSLESCMQVYQKFVTLGFRKTSDYKTDRLPKIHPIDCSDYMTELFTLGRTPHPRAVEAVLIRPKWEIIKRVLRAKTVIFVDYVTGIVPYLEKKINETDFSYVIYTGQEKHASHIDYEDSLEQFIKGNTDILIASIKTVATGVDGLQKVCNNVVFANLPWTNTEYEQAIGRFDRQGSTFDTLDIHIPRTFANLESGEWSWCESKLERLRTKKDVASAAVDGEIPDESQVLSPAKATSYWMEWLQRLDSDGLSELSRTELKVPLDESDEKEVVKRFANYGDFAKLNAKWNTALSSTTHNRLEENPEEWYHYHTEAKKKESQWRVVPRNEIIEQLPLSIPDNAIIADYGCGLAEIEEKMSDKYTVHSLDHVAVNENVVSCDMANSPLEDNTLDAAIFSLSLMGKNIKDYILDAHRTLKPGGQLIVYHPAKGNDRQKFIKGIESNGFVLIKQGKIYKWHYVWAINQSKNNSDSSPISF